jgi:hypothetical protein
VARYCASCGTEVDDTAIFCPTCGQPIDQETEAAIPPAPAWPDPSESQAGVADAGAEPTRPIGPAPRDDVGQPERGWEPSPDVAAPEPSAWDAPAAPPPDPREAEPIRPVSERRIDARPASTVEAPMADERGAWEERERPLHGGPTGGSSGAELGASDAVAPRAVQAAEPGRMPSSPPRPSAPGSPAPRATPPAPGASSNPLANVPFTAPVTLSGWLIGIGTALGALGALISLFDGAGAVVELLLLIALAAVALTVFFSSALPAFGQLRLATLAIVFAALGAGADRLLSGGRAGPGELLLFLGAATAAIGVLLVELGRDQPLGGSTS